MGGGGGSPPAYNAQQAATDQTKSNVSTAVANATLGNTNQVTPYGNLTYAQTGGQQVGDNWVPSYTATQTLSPEQRAIYDKTTGLQSGALDLAKTGLGQVGSALSSPYDISHTQQLPTDQSAFRGQAYDSLMSRFNTDFDKTKDATNTALLNQGLAPGSAAYNTQMDVLNRTKTDAGNQAYLQAGNLAGQNLNQAQTIHNSQVADYNATRDQPINEYSSIFGLGKGVTQPTYAQPSAGQVAPTDVAGQELAAYQGQLNAHNQSNANSQATMGGMFGLGGSALMAGGMMFM